MKQAAFSLAAGLLLSLSFTAAATTLYVDISNPGPAAPYTNWVTAATNIQDAVDASTAGDEVVVTNGVYQTGGRVVYGSLANRLAVTKPVVVSSVNGPGVTVIKGYQVPGIINGDGAVRCVYLTNGAWLVGFTLTNGATRTAGDVGQEQSGGGVWCETSAVVSNCIIAGNSAWCGGGACYGTLNNCTVTGNSATNGGGAYSGTLSNCTLMGNSAFFGGGGCDCTLNNCTLAGNSAYGGGGAFRCTLNACALNTNSATGGIVYDDGYVHVYVGGGGGAYYGTLNGCALNGNSATGFGMLVGSGSGFDFNYVCGGGGVYHATLNNCTLTGNSATCGGGAISGTLNNCTLTGNSALGVGPCDSNLGEGGGAYSSMLNNCTLTSNSATCHGGGAWFGTLNNCIIYYNSAPGSPNYSSITLNYCCTTQLPATGVGNFTNAPLFVNSSGGNFRLQSNSPCIDAGLNAYAPGVTDLDGRPRIVGTAVDVGAYEFQGGVSGLFIGWLQGYGLPTDGSADYADPDGDRMNNWQEWQAGTNPTNAASVLRLQSTVVQPAGVTLTWASVTNRAYFVQRATNLMPPPAFSLLQTNIPGLPGTTSFTDTNPPASGPAFYRVGVQQ